MLTMFVLILFMFQTIVKTIDNKTIIYVDIDSTYDLNSGIASVNQKVSLSGYIPNVLNIPLITIPENNSVEIISITDQDGNTLIYSFHRENSTVSIYLNQTITSNLFSINIEYLVNELFDEIGPGLFIYTLDLSVFNRLNYVLNGINVRMTIYSPRNLTLVYVEPSDGVKLSKRGDIVFITISKPLLYFIILSHSLPLETKTVSTGVFNNVLLLALISVIGISIGLTSYYFLFRKRFKIEIETLPSDILQDDTTRRIIEIIGDSGEEGVKQSELVELTKRPKSSISRRVKRLNAEGYIEIIRKGKYNIVKLSDKGFEAYKNIKRKER